MPVKGTWSEMESAVSSSKGTGVGLGIDVEADSCYINNYFSLRQICYLLDLLKWSLLL